MLPLRGTLATMLLTVRIPPGSERGPQYMDQTLAALHHALHGRDPLTLIIGHFAGHVGLAFECSTRLKHTVGQQLSAQYPECELEVAQGQDPPTSAPATWAMSVRLAPDVFPLKTYRRFEDLLNRTTADPLAALLAAVGDVFATREVFVVSILMSSGRIENTFPTIDRIFMFTPCPISTAAVLTPTLPSV